MLQHGRVQVAAPPTRPALARAPIAVARVPAPTVHTAWATLSMPQHRPCAAALAGQQAPCKGTKAGRRATNTVYKTVYVTYYGTQKSPFWPPKSTLSA
jgi:hypothetical protein